MSVKSFFQRRDHLLRDTLRVDNFLEHVNHIKELAVDVADDDDWLLDAQHVWFRSCKAQQSQSVNQEASQSDKRQDIQAELARHQSIHWQSQANLIRSLY